MRSTWISQAAVMGVGGWFLWSAWDCQELETSRVRTLGLVLGGLRKEWCTAPLEQKTLRTMRLDSPGPSLPHSSQERNKTVTHGASSRSGTEHENEAMPFRGIVVAVAVSALEL